MTTSQRQAKRQRAAKRRARKVANRNERRAVSQQTPHPLRFYRPGRLAELLDVDPSTVWRWWRHQAVLPPPIQIGGIRGWREDQVAHLLQAEVAP